MVTNDSFTLFTKWNGNSERRVAKQKQTAAAAECRLLRRESGTSRFAKVLATVVQRLESAIPE